MIFLSISLYAQCCTTEALPDTFKKWCCNSIQTQNLVKHFQKIILLKYILWEHLGAELKMTHPESQQHCGIENWSSDEKILEHCQDWDLYMYKHYQRVWNHVILLEFYNNSYIWIWFECTFWIIVTFKKSNSVLRFTDRSHSCITNVNL